MNGVEVSAVPPCLTPIQILILAKLIYQFPARASVQQTELLAWIGFREAPNNLLIGGEVALIILLVVQRVSLRWVDRYEEEIVRHSPHCHLHSSLLSA